ncbi:ATP-binding cassette domain-containing protein [Sunxiuqinia sp. A32]|uniref:ATP-binding cassette domain-containing protein n=1 Tax=Sunxiuqinia sp. A32 TaxID=3461496 RepID=UPI00404671D1
MPFEDLKADSLSLAKSMNCSYMDVVQSNFLKIVDLNLKIDGKAILNNVTFSLMHNESLAITGASGSGKTLLGKVISGRLRPSAGDVIYNSAINPVMVDQQDHFIFFSGRASMHYGQRYESTGMDHGPTVETFLKKFISDEKEEMMLQEVSQVVKQMEISHLTERKLLDLSNGERKRVQLAAALLQKAGLLVLDQPFVGLDVHSREKLSSLLEQVRKAGVLLIIICDPHHIPNTVTKVLELKDGRQNQFVDRKDYQPEIEIVGHHKLVDDNQFLSLLKEVEERFEDVILMKKVNVNLNGKQILQDVDWNVKQGERWALLGHNGAGKTTLLSLISADNPQGYDNHLILFDRKRGSGESIWDIKKKIGLVSPELHLYFLRGAGIFNTIPGLADSSYQAYSRFTCRDVVLSGFRDEVGFTSKSTEYQDKMADAWLSVLNLSHLGSRMFIHASLGEQRSVLLARALVKSPALLVLDEPCQGLDHLQTKHFTSLIDVICKRLKITLIYVTHHYDEIPKSVTHLLQLEQGKVTANRKFVG